MRLRQIVPHDAGKQQGHCSAVGNRTPLLLGNILDAVPQGMSCASVYVTQKESGKHAAERHLVSRFGVIGAALDSALETRTSNLQRLPRHRIPKRVALLGSGAFQRVTDGIQTGHRRQ